MITVARTLRLTLAMAGLLVVLATLTVWMPQLLLGPLDSLGPKDAASLRNGVGANLVSGAVVGAALFTGVVAWRTYQTTRESQWAQQFAISVKDLAKSSAILEMSALARIDALAAEWVFGRPPIEATLASYLRSQSIRQAEKSESALDEAAEARPSAPVSYAVSALSRVHGMLDSQTRVDLRLAGLRGLEISGVDLHWIRLYGADLSLARLHEVNLSTVPMRSARLDAAQFTDCNLSSADLRGADVRFATFMHCSMIGILGSELVADGARVCANLDKASLRNSSFVGADLRGSTLTQADFSGANLSGALLDRVDLRQTSLEGANLAGARITRTFVDDKELQLALGYEQVNWAK